MKFAHHHHRRGGVSVGHTRVARNDIESTPPVRVGCFDDDGGGGGVRTEITATTTTTTTTRIVIINNRTTVSTKAAAVLHGDRLGRCAYNWLVPGVASLRPWQARCVVYPSPRAARGFFGSTQFSRPRRLPQVMVFFFIISFRATLLLFSTAALPWWQCMKRARSGCRRHEYCYTLYTRGFKPL